MSNNYKSTPRNRVVVDYFKDLGLIEKYGSGIQRVIGYFQEEKLPIPEFKNISEGFQVTVFSADSENVTESRHSRILKIISGNNKISYDKLALQLSVARMTIYRDIEKLKVKGLIERIGSDKGGYWKVKGN